MHRRNAIGLLRGFVNSKLDASEVFDSNEMGMFLAINQLFGSQHGVRWGNINKNRTPVQDLGKTYFSSGFLEKDFKKNPDSFRIKLIATFDTREEARDYEVKQNKKNIKNKRYANISAYPQIVSTPETRRKMSETRKGVKKGPFSKEHRRKLSESHKGIKLNIHFPCCNLPRSMSS